MLLLTNTSSAVEINTSQDGSIDYHVDAIDNASGTITPLTPANGNIATAVSNTTILGAPGASTQRNVKGISISNTSGSVSNVVTVKHYDGTTRVQLKSVTLLPGESLMFDAVGNWHHYDAWGGEYQGRPALESWNMMGIEGTIAESIPRMLCSEANLSALTSGTLFLQAVYLRAGQQITSISFCSATTAAGTPTNQIFGLFDSSRALLANTNNNTTTSWSANTVRTLNLTSVYTVPADGLYYVGILVTATTVPTMKGLTAKTASQLAGTAPILHGNSSTGLTTALPNPAAAITVGVNALWCALK